MLSHCQLRRFRNLLALWTIRYGESCIFHIQLRNGLGRKWYLYQGYGSHCKDYISYKKNLYWYVIFVIQILGWVFPFSGYRVLSLVEVSLLQSWFEYSNCCLFDVDLEFQYCKHFSKQGDIRFKIVARPISQVFCLSECKKTVFLISDIGYKMA